MPARIVGMSRIFCCSLWVSVVNSSTVFRGLLVILFLLSVAWKVVVPAYHQNDQDENIVRFFERNHFEALVIEVNGAPIIEAKRGSCSLQIATLVADGSNGNLIRHHFKYMGAEYSFVVFRGQVYAHEPFLLPVISSFWSRIVRQLGFMNYITPIIIVGTSSNCDAERLPWGQLSNISDVWKAYIS